VELSLSISEVAKLDLFARNYAELPSVSTLEKGR